MRKYNTFLTVFIISILSLIFFLVIYFHAIFSIVLFAHRHIDPEPFEILSVIFSPAVIISGLVMGISNLVYRILGIVNIAKSKTVSDGEKVLWIIGFILLGFITAIIFLVMAKEKKFVE